MSWLVPTVSLLATAGQQRGWRDYLLGTFPLVSLARGLPCPPPCRVPWAVLHHSLAPCPSPTLPQDTTTFESLSSHSSDCGTTVAVAHLTLSFDDPDLNDDEAYSSSGI